MNRDVETYRDHPIVEQETRGQIGFAVRRPGGGTGVGDFLATALPDIEAARARVDRIIEKAAQNTRWP